MLLCGPLAVQSLLSAMLRKMWAWNKKNRPEKVWKDDDFGWFKTAKTFRVHLLPELVINFPFNKVKRGQLYRRLWHLCGVNLKPRSLPANLFGTVLVKRPVKLRWYRWFISVIFKLSEKSNYFAVQHGTKELILEPMPNNIWYKSRPTML